MGHEKKIKIICISVAVLIIIGIVLGLVLGLRSLSGGELTMREKVLLQREIFHRVEGTGESEVTELQVWPRGPNGSALIAYSVSDLNSSMKHYMALRRHFRHHSRNITIDNELVPMDHRVPCNYSGALALTEKQICDSPIGEDFYPCVKDMYYNYRNGTPCVFLTLTKVLNWTPKPYNTSEELPTNMPEDLKAHIKSLVGRPEASEVWVSCEGESPADKRNMGLTKYLPAHGFPAYYFPYTKKEDYLSPLVALLFQNPKKGVTINVVCKAWARNIACADCEPSATARFQLLVKP